VVFEGTVVVGIVAVGTVVVVGIVVDGTDVVVGVVVVGVVVGIVVVGIVVVVGASALFPIPNPSVENNPIPNPFQVIPSEDVAWKKNVKKKKQNENKIDYLLNLFLVQHSPTSFVMD